MTTLNRAVDAIERYLGFSETRIRTTARALQEAGTIPMGAPRRQPVLTVEHVVSLILALALDMSLHNSARAVAEYRALVPGGANLHGAPPAITRSAGDALDILAQIAINGDSADWRRDMIEIVSNWPEIAVHGNGAVTRYVAPGANPEQWQAAGYRRATTITAAAFIDTISTLFKESKHG